MVLLNVPPTFGSLLAMAQCRSSLAAFHCTMCVGAVQMLQTWAKWSFTKVDMAMRVELLFIKIEKDPGCDHNSRKMKGPQAEVDFAIPY